MISADSSDDYDCYFTRRACPDASTPIPERYWLIAPQALSRSSSVYLSLGIRRAISWSLFRLIVTDSTCSARQADLCLL